MTSGAAWLWFLGCYSPLFAIVAIRGWLGGSATLAIAGAAIAVVSVVSNWISIHLADPPIPIEVEAVETRDIDVATYVVTFVLPLVLIPTGSLPDVVAAALIFVVIGLVSVGGATVLPNPTVQAFGYRWMTLVTSNGRLTALVKRRTAEAIVQPSVTIGGAAGEARVVRIRHIGSGLWIIGDDRASAN